MEAVTSTNFNFENQKSLYVGKVRDVYNIADEMLVMVVSDRISAFDVVLPKGIPFKGQILNTIAAKFLDATADIVPNWKISTPDPMVTLGKKCEPLKLEVIVRGYLAGSAWREYQSGMRELCGIKLPEGMKENDKFPTPIITPTTKADEGHDENISKGIACTYEEIVADVEKRDRIDSSRAFAPLKPAEDSIELDTSDMNIEEVVEAIIKIIDEKIKEK